MAQMARSIGRLLMIGLFLVPVHFGGAAGCGGAATDGGEGGDDGGGGDFAGTWTYVESLDSQAPTVGLCQCGVPGDPESYTTDPNNCGPAQYTITFVVDSSGDVTIQGTDDSWGTINSSGRWSGSPEEEGYVNGAVSGTCTSTSCSGTFTADYVTGSGGAADCYDGTFTMTKN